MSWSLTEARTLAVKAARGAGYSWGLAEEAGFALGWLAAHSLPGPAALAGLLEGGCAGAVPCPRCPLAHGAAMADLGKIPPEAAALRYPLLLVPFAARLAHPVILRWDGAEVSISEAGVRVEGGALLTPASECEIVLASEMTGEQTSPVSRIPNSAKGGLDILFRFAERTYAPATEASRLAGAGAGTTDND